jgi:hypothetical protein
MSRAVDATRSTDIVSMIRYYDGPGWGFASRNFTRSFWPALDIDRNPDAYFGPFAEASPRERSVTLDRPIDIFTAAQLRRDRSTRSRRKTPRCSVPSCRAAYRSPAGYALRLPTDSTDGFRIGSRGTCPTPGSARRTRRPAGSGDERSARRPGRHTPAAATLPGSSGQTLTGIAERYGVSVQALRLANRLGPRDQVRSGQVLRIPAS